MKMQNRTLQVLQKWTVDSWKLLHKELKQYGISEAISFGPVSYCKWETDNYQGDGGNGYAPRTAIGQKENGSVVLLTIDGRDPLKRNYRVLP